MDPTLSLYSLADSEEQCPSYPTPIPLCNYSQPDHLLYEIEHEPLSFDLSRKMHLETQVGPLLDVVRGDSYGPFSPNLASDDIPYHLRETPGRDDLYGQRPVYFEGDYPSPPGPPTTDLSSVPETDRSPSPRAADRYLFPHEHFSHPSIRDLEYVGYGSVTPSELQRIPDPSYPDPDYNDDEVGPIYDACPTLSSPVKMGPADYNIKHEADADGHYLETQPTPAASITKSKSASQRQRKKATKPTSPGIRKRAVAPHNHENKSKALALSSRTKGSADRVFYCSFKQYGCQSSFNSKNEWKRHVASQHMKFGFWRCDLPGCCSSDPPNDFNRKDLFTQHLRRMHKRGQNKKSSVTKESDEFEQSLPEVHRRCWQKQRNAPAQTRCVACNLVFGSWEERMEHMGKHYENGSCCEDVEDPGLVEWALHEGILCRDGLSKRLILTSLANTCRNRK